MRTLILMWNPEISSIKWEDFEREFVSESENANIFDQTWSEVFSDWSVWDHENTLEGDRVFMVKVGKGNTGIVFSGTVDSEPYEGDDWSGKGRKTYYVDLATDTVVNVDNGPFLSTEELQKHIPDFDWTGGHSGRFLSEEDSLKLELLWMEFLYKNRDRYDDIFTSESMYISPTLQQYLRKTKGDDCEICGYNYQKVFGDSIRKYNQYYFYLPTEEDAKRESDCFLDHVYCLCYNCNNAIRVDYHLKGFELQLARK